MISGTSSTTSVALTPFIPLSSQGKGMKGIGSVCPEEKEQGVSPIYLN
jgi:hypothetical protein